MSSYNVYRNRSKSTGGYFPIWLGKVSPIPAGAMLDANDAKAGKFYPAGTPMALASGVASVLHGFVVTAYTTSTDDSIITVKPLFEGDAPKTTDFLQKVAATFGTTGKAWNPDAVAANATDPEAFDITVATANIDVVAEGDFLAFSSAEAEGGSKSLKVQPTHYLYNDIAIDALGVGESDENLKVSCALVNAHAEGILINRTPAAAVKTQMKAACPLVIQEERY